MLLVLPYSQLILSFFLPVLGSVDSCVAADGEGHAIFFALWAVWEPSFWADAHCPPSMLCFFPISKALTSWFSHGTTISIGASVLVRHSCPVLWFTLSNVTSFLAKWSRLELELQQLFKLFMVCHKLQTSGCCRVTLIPPPLRFKLHTLGRNATKWNCVYVLAS